MSSTGISSAGDRRGVVATAAVFLLCAGIILTPPPVAPLEAQEAQEAPEGHAAPAEGLTEVERRAVELCAEARAGDGEGVILGRVVDEATREPVPRAMLWVGTAQNIEAGGWFTASQEGIVLLCGLPAGGEVHLQPSMLGRLGDPTLVRLPEDGVALRDLVLPAGAWVEAGPGARARASALYGLVRAAETGEPLTGAAVEILETGESTVTGGDGRFTFLGLPGGRYRLVTRYLGRMSDTARIALTPDAAAEIAILTLETSPIELPALEVAVQGPAHLAGFYQRMERGVGDFITREDLERLDVVASFRRITGVRVRPAGLSGTRHELVLRRGFGSCPPVIYLDGFLLSAPRYESTFVSAGMGAFERLQNYPRHRLEGIEVYRTPGSAPSRYRMPPGDECGIVLAWTRRR